VERTGRQRRAVSAISAGPPFTKTLDGIVSNINVIIDVFVLIGLLSFPLYLLYWVGYHVQLRVWKRLWGGFASIVAWLLVTIGCFIVPMLSCAGGGCAEKVSPFLQLAVLYAFSSSILIYLLHRFRAKNAV